MAPIEMLLFLFLVAWPSRHADLLPKVPVATCNKLASVQSVDGTKWNAGFGWWAETSLMNAGKASWGASNRWMAPNEMLLFLLLLAWAVPVMQAYCRKSLLPPATN